MIVDSILPFKNRSSLLLTAVFLLGFSYFFYHIFSGERGFLALVTYAQKVHEAQEELDLARAERLSLEQRVQRLRNDSLDLDILDEQARRILGYSAEGEDVYFLN